MLSSVWIELELPDLFHNENQMEDIELYADNNLSLSLVCWCVVIHHHRPQEPTLFRRVRWDFMCVQCDVCTDTGPPGLSLIREDKITTYVVCTVNPLPKGIPAESTPVETKT